MLTRIAQSNRWLPFIGLPWLMISHSGLMAQSSVAPITAKVVCISTIPDSCPTAVTLRVKIDPSLGEKLGSFTGRLTWSSAVLTYTSHSGLLSGFVGAINNSNVSAGELLFSGARAAGVADSVDILTVNLAATPLVGLRTAISPQFTAMAAASTFRDLLPTLAVEGCSLTVVARLLRGDVNGDLAVNSTDALIAQSFDVRLPIPAAFLERINHGVADINGDRRTTFDDVFIILSFDVGIPVPFPIGRKFCP